MVLRKHTRAGESVDKSAPVEPGVLRDDNPLDESPEFRELLAACRRGDLRTCQELIGRGVNINGKDASDYTPLILASLCGHFELVQLLLESGALAERNTFQGERCIYNALNDRIRNLLLQYDFSKTSDPYVYWSSHVAGLLTRSAPRTADGRLVAGARCFDVHKFLLAARTPYFAARFAVQPDAAEWSLPPDVPPAALHLALRFVYLGELPRDLVPPRPPAAGEADVAGDLDRVAKLLGLDGLWEAILAADDRHLARQRFRDEEERALRQLGGFFRANVLGRRVLVDPDRVVDVRWRHDNAAFADVLLRADEPPGDDDDDDGDGDRGQHNQTLNGHGIPLDEPPPRKRPRAALYPAHKAMLIRSEYFATMFSGDFVEARPADHLRVVTVDCSPPVLELVLGFLYTESANCPLEHALDLLYAADMLLLDGLKTKAAVAISTLGCGSSNALVDRTHAPRRAADPEPVNIYDVIHAAWDLGVHRLELFAARYLAGRLEDYVDDPDFAGLIRASAARLRRREETDTIELLDDIRYYLSERFRLRFEDAGLDGIMAADQQPPGSADAPACPRPPTGSADHLARPREQPPGSPDAPARPPPQAVRTLDGATADDEFSSDAINYQVLLGKIDAMLERLDLDA